MKLVDENTAGDAMFRDDARRAPHNLFGHPDGLWSFGGTPVPPPPLFQYLRPASSRPGAAATSVSIGYRRDYAVGYTLGRGVGHVVAHRRTAGRSCRAPARRSRPRTS